jgi:anti-anti-sigma factor
VIDVTVFGPRAVVCLAGEFEAANSDEIRFMNAGLVAEDVSELTVDFSRVTSMASAGLNRLLAASKLIEAGGRRMVIVGGETAEFLAGLHRPDAPLYVRTGPSIGRTHVLDVATGETLCGAKNQSSHPDSNPDLATCLPCWTAWEQRGGSLASG